MSNVPAAAVMPLPPIIGTTSRYGVGNIMRAYGYGAPGSQGWQAAKLVVYVPLLLDQDATVLKVWWMNGATVGTNNVDCGIYASAAGIPTTKIISSGSTLSANASVVQVVDVADTLLRGPGLYFFALTLDGTTATIYRATAPFGFAKTLGLLEEVTGSFGLPATATPVAYTRTNIPVFGFSTVTTI